VLTLLENADIYAPEPLGIGGLLVGGGKLLYLGPERPALDARVLGETLDLAGMPVIPGLVDAHVHATGGCGEDGFSTQAPPVPLSGFTRHGVTTVVGLLGTDDETRTTAGLLARTRALREEGLSAWCWTGGYHLPPTTLTGSVRGDIVHIDCVIGRASWTSAITGRVSRPRRTGRRLRDARGRALSRKAGDALHLGDGDRGLVWSACCAKPSCRRGCSTRPTSTAAAICSRRPAS
jgi:beta-aspartyl-dipeptidase (metallo-type)